jgi:hypothetical protein
MFVQPDYVEISVHNSPITCLEVTHDLKYIVSGAEDGTMYIVKLNLLERYYQIKIKCISNICSIFNIPNKFLSYPY